MTHYRDTTEDISTQPLTTEMPVTLKDVEAGTPTQAPAQKHSVHRGSEKRSGCHTTWRNEDMSQQPVKSPRQRPHTRPMTDNELQHKTNIIALIGFIVLAVFVGLMCFLLGATAWMTAASSGGVLTVGVWQFFKTLQGGKDRKP